MTFLFSSARVGARATGSRQERRCQRSKRDKACATSHSKPNGRARHFSGRSPLCSIPRRKLHQRSRHRRQSSNKQRRRQMLDERTRIAVLELGNKQLGSRRIARALGISRSAVRDILHSGESQLPDIERQEKAEPYREEIMAL